MTGGPQRVRGFARVGGSGDPMTRRLDDPIALGREQAGRKSMPAPVPEACTTTPNARCTVPPSAGQLFLPCLDDRPAAATAVHGTAVNAIKLQTGDRIHNLFYRATA